VILALNWEQHDRLALRADHPRGSSKLSGGYWAAPVLKLHALELRRRRAVTSQFFICFSEKRPANVYAMSHGPFARVLRPMAREVGLRIHCSNRLGCRCALIPITRQWPVAKRLRRRVKRSKERVAPVVRPGPSGPASRRREPEQSRSTRTVPAARNAGRRDESRSGAPDLPPNHSAGPDASIALQQAAAYMRLARILERSGDLSEALQVTEPV